MASGVIRQGNHRLENLFFSGMAVLILGTVFLGFARSYYLAGVFKAPLPNLIVHIHGAVFSSWILLLIAQTSLVAAGRTDLHRRLGLLGFALACVVVILGLLAATRMSRLCAAGLNRWRTGSGSQSVLRDPHRRHAGLLDVDLFRLPRAI